MTPEIIARVYAWLVSRKHDALVAAWVIQADLWALLAENGADQRGATAALSGILLALVREAWGDPGLSVSPSELWRDDLGHAVRTGEWDLDFDEALIVLGRYPFNLAKRQFPTEAEALVAALEEAP